MIFLALASRLRVGLKGTFLSRIFIRFSSVLPITKIRHFRRALLSATRVRTMLPKGFPFGKRLHWRVSAGWLTAADRLLMTLIGYARVSTDEQHLDLQRDALKAAGCGRVFEDEGISAVARVRPGFTLALEMLCPGDVFVVWKMDRAFRSLRHALDVLEDFEKNGIEFRALTEQIDTTTPMGKCMYQIRNAFAELERNLISERTKAGMAAARKRGKTFGRPHKLTKRQVKRAAEKLAADPELSIAALAKELKVSPRTLRREIRSDT